MKDQINLGQIYHVLGADLRALNTLWNSGQNEMGRRVFAAFVFSAFQSVGWLLVNYVNERIGESGKGLLTDTEIACAKRKESSKENNPVEYINFALKYDGDVFAIRVGRWKTVFLEQNHEGFDIWRLGFEKLRAPKFFDLLADPFECGDSSMLYDLWQMHHAYIDYGAVALVSARSTPHSPIARSPPTGSKPTRNTLITALLRLQFERQGPNRQPLLTMRCG
jgi:hypothetical protein